MDDENKMRELAEKDARLEDAWRLCITKMKEAGAPLTGTVAAIDALLRQIDRLQAHLLRSLT